MNAPAQQPALRIGRDPNGATWRVVRSPADWRTARLSGLGYDALRGVLELLPTTETGELSPAERARYERRANRAMTDIVVGCDGAAYRSDPHTDRVLVRRVCDSEFSPLVGFGGRGGAVGQLRRPLGLAVDARGLLYVADAGNHRVQIVSPADGHVVAVLGARDAWGAPVAGLDSGAMTEPVDVAVDDRTCCVYVLDRAGERIHVFNGHFGHERSFAPLRTGPGADDPAAPPRDLVAIAVDDDGTILVADLAWPRLLHADRDGRGLAEVGIGASGHPRFDGLRAAEMLEADGTAELGPIDSNLPGVDWHRVLVDADAPAGTGIEVQTYASDDVADTPVWAPANPITIPIPDVEPAAGEYDRLVLPAAPGPSVDRGTDKGRYLWVRLRLIGRMSRPSDSHSVATPSVRAVRALFPRNSYLASLPRVYGRRGDQPPGSVFLERWLALFESQLTSYEQRYEDVSRHLNVDAAPAEWLRWMASWFATVFDPSWPIERRRLLLRELASLYRRRGTPRGLSRFLEIYTGRRPALIESWTLRPGPPTALGDGVVLGDTSVGEAEGDPKDFAHRFTAYVYLDSSADREIMEPVARKILETERPAHTAYELRIVLPDARVGTQSRVGVDFVVGGAPQFGAIVGFDAEPSRADFRPILGSASLAGSRHHDRQLDTDFRIE